MGLDIRLPIGMMFVVLGPIILVTGLVRGESLSIRTGSAMSIFGVFMLWLGILGQKRANAEALAEAATEAKKAESGPHVLPSVAPGAAHEDNVVQT